MNEKVVIVSNGYDRIDGRNAYQSDIKRLTLGAPMLEENNKMQIAAQIWKNDKDGKSTAKKLPLKTGKSITTWLLLCCQLLGN